MINRFIIFYSSIIIIFLSSCKHKNFDEYVGPALCPSENFRIINFKVSTEQIDFNSINYDSITASFSEVATWEVNLIGKNSGAKKNYKGRSSDIVICWYGESSTADKFFKSGEEVLVTMQISCISESYTKTIYILNENRFTNQNNSFLLISDFEGNGYVRNKTNLGYKMVNGALINQKIMPLLNLK